MSDGAIPFLDLAADFAEVEADARRRIDGVLARQLFVLGPETRELEVSLSQRLDGAHAIAVSSGSDALYLALLALGIGRGDAVLLPAFTFFATAGAVARAGAVPVFCDLEASGFLAGATQMREAIARFFEASDGELRHRASGARLRALLPVHLYGEACAMQGIVELAREHGLRVIEDAAQAIDARSEGRAAGSFGDAGCFSFYPTKNLGGAGDGGLLLCRDDALAQRFARLRSHGGVHGSYEQSEIGINARMSELVAAVLNAKLARLDAWNQSRRRIAARYTEKIKGSGTLNFKVPDPFISVWHQYALRLTGASAAERDAVQAKLEARGIQTRVFYPLPLHLQPCFASLGGKPGDLPGCEAAAREVLCLPIYASLSDGDVDRVAEALVAVLRES